MEFALFRLDSCTVFHRRPRINPQLYNPVNGNLPLDEIERMHIWGDTMPTEFWQLMDTVVKIGLGAVIAGVVTFFITRLKHRQTVVEAAVRRRLEVIEGITTGVAEFGNAVARYCVLTEDIVNVIYRQDSTIGDPPPQWVKEREALGKYLKAGGVLEKPEGLLYLVSADGTLPMALFEFQRLAGDVMFCAGQHEQDIEMSELNQKLGLFKKQAAVLMAELGKVYRSPTI